MRIIDADKLEAKCKEIIAQERKYGTATVSWAQAYESFLDLLETTPTITADDYFDAVDRIKPCPKCRYTLLGALTEDEPRWISVTERLPECRVPVLTYGRKGAVGIGFVQPTSVTADGKVYFYARYGDSLPTHWMPLPSPVKGE